MKKFRWIRNRVKELCLFFRNITFSFKTKKKIIICVDDGPGGFSSGLRGYELARELREFGWRAIVIPKQFDLSQRYRIIKRESPDFIFLQSCRHQLNDPQLYPGWNCVFDLDDADFVDPKMVKKVNDCASLSVLCIAGSRFVADYLRHYNSQVVLAWTGSRPRVKPDDKNIIKKTTGQKYKVTWACSNPHDYPNEANLIKDVLIGLDPVVKSKFIFYLAGVRDFEAGELYLQDIVESGLECQMLPFMKYNELLDRLDEIDIGLAPILPKESPFSAGKSFGKILAYLNSHVAVIASNDVDHPLFFKHKKNGMLVNTVDEWRGALKYLLSSDTILKKVNTEAFYDYQQNLSISAFTKKVDNVLTEYLER